MELKRFLSFRLMIALWLLMMVVLDNSYTGTYTANMAVPKLEPTVDTLEELAASNKFRITIELNTDIGFKALVDNEMWKYHNILKLYQTVLINYRRPRVGRTKSLETLFVEIRNFCSPDLWMEFLM